MVFWLCGTKKGSYSIFNKKYSKEEYEILHARIVEHMKNTGEWGEFFPHWASPFAYNETAAQEWFPLSHNPEKSSRADIFEREDKDKRLPSNPAREVNCQALLVV